MVDANGQRLSDWVCPAAPHGGRNSWPCSKTCSTITASTGSTSTTSASRVPESANARHVVLSFRAGPRVKWPLGLELFDQSDTQAAWFDYRSDLIRDLTEEFATAIRNWQGGVRGLGGIEARRRDQLRRCETLWAELPKLTPLLDFVAPAAYHQLEGEPLGWVRAVQLSARWRSGFTPVWHGIQAYEDRAHRPMEISEFARAAPLDALGKRRCGVVCAGAHALSGHRGRKPRQHAPRCRRDGALGPRGNRSQRRARRLLRRGLTSSTCLRGYPHGLPLKRPRAAGQEWFWGL